MPITVAEPEMLMPLDEAPRLDHLAEMKRQIDQAAQDYADRVQEGVRTLLGSVQSFDENCRVILREASNGRAAEMHAIRGPFLDAYQGTLKRLRLATELTRHASRVACRDLPEVALLDAELGGLGLRWLSLASRWHRAEDLERLTEEQIRQRMSQVEFRRSPPDHRGDVLRRSADLAEEDYRTNRELLSFEAFGEKDLYDEYPDADKG